MKTKLKIIIPAVVAVAAIIIAVLCLQFTPASTNETPDIVQMLSTAQKYLSEQSFEQAIAEFEKVISLEPKNVEAYKGIADAYIGLGKPDKAIEWLEKGIAETDSDDLRDKLAEILESMKIPVPEIENLDRDSIEQTLSEANIKYTITEEYSDSVPAGKIISDNIPDDNKLGDGDIVEIIISLGVEKVKVPDFSNLSYSEAETLAKDSKLTVSRNEMYNKEIEAEHIITQVIPANAEVPVNTNVVLTVSRGVEMVTVPDLTNLSREEAEKILADNKLAANFTEEYNDTVEKGKVIKQSVIKNSEVEAETIIDIVISAGKNNSAMYLLSNLTKPCREKEAFGYDIKYNKDGTISKINQYWDELNYPTDVMRVFDFSYKYENNDRIKITVTETRGGYVDGHTDVRSGFYYYDIKNNKMDWDYNDCYMYMIYDYTEMNYDSVIKSYVWSENGKTYKKQGWSTDPNNPIRVCDYVLISVTSENSYILDMNRWILACFDF